MKKSRIDKKTFEKYISGNASKMAIAMAFEVSNATLETWIHETYNMNFTECKRAYFDGTTKERD